jgi:hypothetical protein
MKIAASIGLCIFVYWAIALVMCGSLIQPIALLTIFHDRLGAPFWGCFVLAGAITGLIVASPICLKNLQPALRAPLFLAIWMLFSVFSVGIYADRLRTATIAEFHADEEFQHSFFFSIRIAPREGQFDVHSIVLKNCATYAWSYRAMKLFPMATNIAINVGPYEWIGRCKMKRT